MFLRLEMVFQPNASIHRIITFSRLHSNMRIIETFLNLWKYIKHFLENSQALDLMPREPKVTALSVPRVAGRQKSSPTPSAKRWQSPQTASHRGLSSSTKLRDYVVVPNSILPQVAQFAETKRSPGCWREALFSEAMNGLLYGHWATCCGNDVLIPSKVFWKSEDHKNRTNFFFTYMQPSRLSVVIREAWGHDGGVYETCHTHAGHRWCCESVCMLFGFGRHTFLLLGILLCNVCEKPETQPCASVRSYFPGRAAPKQSESWETWEKLRNFLNICQAWPPFLKFRISQCISTKYT